MDPFDDSDDAMDDSDATVDALTLLREDHQEVLALFERLPADAAFHNSPSLA